LHLGFVKARFVEARCVFELADVGDIDEPDRRVGASDALPYAKGERAEVAGRNR
jgi:hypothetical protein